MISSDVKSNYKTVLEANGVLSFVPGGISMWPIIKNRKQSVIVKKKDGKLSKYDVALYQRSNGTFVLHRVIEPTEQGYIMCGDSQFTLETVAEDQVFGVMVGFYRKKRYIESTDEAYIKEVENWYGNKARRQRKLKWFYRYVRVKSIFNRAINKLKGRKNKNV